VVVAARDAALSPDEEAGIAHVMGNSTRCAVSAPKGCGSVQTPPRRALRIHLRRTVLTGVCAHTAAACVPQGVEQVIRCTTARPRCNSGSRRLLQPCRQLVGGDCAIIVLAAPRPPPDCCGGDNS
jgi:hypothetical protein